VKIIDFLESDVLPYDEKSDRKILLTSDSFYLGKDGLLYHLDRNHKRNARDSFSQLVVPQSMRYEILSNVHDQVVISGCIRLSVRLRNGIGRKECSKTWSIGVRRRQIVL